MVRISTRGEILHFVLRTLPFLISVQAARREYERKREYVSPEVCAHQGLERDLLRKRLDEDHL